MRVKNRSALALLLVTTFLLSSCGAASGAKKAPEERAAEAADLEVYFFDAGKADAILLTTANSAVLIDAGEKGFGKTVLACLEEKGVERLDCLIITHFDQDHVGGAARIINHIEVGAVLQSSRPKDSEEYEKYVKALANAEIEPVTVQETLVFALDGVSYTVDPPRQAKYSSDNSNNSSLIVSARNGANGFLFMGDAQTERLSEFLAANSRTYDVLKVPHHGKDEPLLGALIESTQPAYAVITSSDDEPESAEVVETLESAGVKALLTREGAVTLRGDGAELALYENGA
ncbi:MAG: MBL fold metallo-hydrolase [Oscillospiraceae bacterium]|nr:MBL fold metallo-hydrolase [Oscillospiraceae bacterium]